MNKRYEELRKRSEDLKNRTFKEFWTDVLECSELIKEINPNPRRPWIADVIHEMFAEQNGRCAITGDLLEPSSFEVDHIIPVSYGGANERANLRLVNRRANRSRGNRGVSPTELLRYLEDRYQNR